ncbi:MAG: pilus assembly protein, partial [Gammaproteobacteria bacterium]|nr:pilus assembly protein [Gammaproteobacteria bacterium]
VAAGYSAVVTNIIPEDNVWEVTATVDDDLTGATSSIHQGVEIRMLAGNCP